MSWHNNHHAFPGSARLGLYPGQRLIRMFEACGLAAEIKTPAYLPERRELQRPSI